MEDKIGQIALSNLNLDEDTVKKIVDNPFTSAGFEYKFYYPSEEELKKFWEEHGSHYDMVTKQKLRRMKKRKKEEQGNGGTNKRQKTGDSDRSYNIAGVTYTNINKVKSKAKAIMNVKDNGQKLEGYEEEFMKELLKHHAKHEQKMKDFSHFSVDEHPDFQNTR